MCVCVCVCVCVWCGCGGGWGVDVGCTGPLPSFWAIETKEVISRGPNSTGLKVRAYGYKTKSSCWSTYTRGDTEVRW